MKRVAVVASVVVLFAGIAWAQDQGKKRGLRQVSLGKEDEVTRNLSMEPCG